MLQVTVNIYSRKQKLTHFRYHYTESVLNIENDKFDLIYVIATVE